MRLSSVMRASREKRRRLVYAGWLGLLAPMTLSAQAVDSSPATSPPMVHAVVIERSDIFDAADLTKWYARVANGVHIMTRESVIQREILFRAGEPYDSARVAETERNLRGLGIFRLVTIDTVGSDSGLVVRVSSHDAWSTQADARISSGGGEVIYSLSLNEINFLGTGSRAGAAYRKDPDRTALSLAYGSRRFLGKDIALNMFLDARSDGTIFSGSVARPLRSLDSRSAYSLFGTAGDFTVLRFRDGNPEPAQVLRRKLVLGRLGGVWTVKGDRRRQLQANLTGQLRRDDFVPDSAVPTPFPKTITAALGGAVTLVTPRFSITRGVMGFGREEDVNLTTSVSLGVWAAPEFLGYPVNGVGLSFNLRTGLPVGQGYLRFGASANGLFGGEGADSGTVVFGSTVALKPGARQVVFLHGEVGWQRNPTPGAEFDLGLTAGLRAFRAHAFTGTRMFYTSAEIRHVLTREALGLFGLALAAFTDYGGAWFADEPRRSGWDAGFGIRAGVNRSNDVDAFRVDLVYRFPSDVMPPGWVISVGRSLPFTLLPQGRS
jgi:hypothetical protein